MLWPTSQLGRQFQSLVRKAQISNSAFYRRFRYTAPISIFEVDRRVFISTELRVLFNGIGKAGHSSVVASLARLQLGRDAPINEAKSRLFKVPSALGAEDVAGLDTYFKFTFVRNPYTRTLSAFLDKVARGKVVPPRLAKRLGTRPPRFLDFCLYLDDGGLNDDVHWAPQTSMMVLPIDLFDLIGRLESFDQDLAVVMTRLGLGAQNPVGRHDPHRTDANKSRDSYYCDRSREIVSRLMADDFRLLGYPTEF